MTKDETTGQSQGVKVVLRKSHSSSVNVHVNVIYIYEVAKFCEMFINMFTHPVFYVQSSIFALPLNSE